jgi:general stress protein 26
LSSQLTQPAAVLDSRFATPGAEPVRWAEGQAIIEDAEIFWLATVRADGQPHVTPLLMVFLDDALYFCTGAAEQKARNLANSPRVTVTTGNNAYRSGTDVVIEGVAEQVTDPRLLDRIADRFLSKYEWRYELADGGFIGAEGVTSPVYRVVFQKGFAFQRGGEYGQTCWDFRS